MKFKSLAIGALALSALCMAATPVVAQMGKRFPSEKKIVPDPVTGIPLTFLTTAPSGDDTLYQTHQGWTADGKWIVFRSGTRGGAQGAQAYAVNEESGVIVQLTEGPGNGFGSGGLNVAQKSMKLYFTRSLNAGAGRGATTAPSAESQTPIYAQTQGRGAAGTQPASQPGTQPGGRAGRGARGGGGGGGGGGGLTGIYEIDLAKLFADSEAGTLKSRENYERLCGSLPGGGGGFGLDANEKVAYVSVRVSAENAKLPEGTKIEPNFGARTPPMGAGPAGIRKLDLATGEVTHVIDVGVQIGHLQANPFNPGEIIYCWETGGKAPTRAWVVNADGTNNRPVFAEEASDWVTHETVVSKDEVAIGILGHRAVGTNDGWGVAGTHQFPTGVGVVNLRTKEMLIEGQVPLTPLAEGARGSRPSVWHVNGSYDGRWLTADDFQRSIWLWDRKNSERHLISTGHRTTAADHPHPIFNPSSTKILVQSAMIAPDERAHDLCVIPIPKAWLNKTYSDKAPE